MNDPRLIPFREYMRRSRPWWWWLNPWGYADALEIIQAEAFRAAAGPEAPPPTSDAVRCAWCGAALAQDPDAPHRWRCDRAVQGKCVARGYWYVLCDDLAGVREAALVTDTAGTPSDAVREAAEVVRTILTAHDARLSESGVLTYGPPSKGTGFVAAIQWLRRYDAARGGE